MPTLSRDDLQAMKRADESRKRYQYGTLRRKSADKTYDNLKHRLAQQYGCTAHEIETAYKEDV
jgi:hypothetical protein